VEQANDFHTNSDPAYGFLSAQEQYSQVVGGIRKVTLARLFPPTKSQPFCEWARTIPQTGSDHFYKYTENAAQLFRLFVTKKVKVCEFFAQN